MPTLEWLKNEFGYGYDSGDILSRIPSLVRRKEERRIGGSYRAVFHKAILPYINTDSKVLEIGPGKGSWSKAILKHLPEGELHTIDFQDATRWLSPNDHGGRLICHKVADNSSYSFLKNDYFDFCWSFGVLCHSNAKDIQQILNNIFPKMKWGGIAIHQYADWEKLDHYGWKRGAIPCEFKTRQADQIWWPCSRQQTISSLASTGNWEVIQADLGLVLRDSIIMLSRS